MQIIVSSRYGLIAKAFFSRWKIQLARRLQVLASDYANDRSDWVKELASSL